MEQIAWILGSFQVYWSSLLTALAGAAAICIYLALLFSDGEGRGAAVSVPVAVLLSLMLSRFVHWYCRSDQYSSLAAAMTDFTSGGYALVGVFAGCLLTALLLRLVHLTENLPRMLDCMSVAACGGIGVGRLACFFNGQNRGMVVSELAGLPWACPVANPVSGTQEMRLATFFLQAIVAGCLLAGLLLFRLGGQKKPWRRDGDICLIFLLCYGASQVLLDSTRYDSLYFRSNGFVSIVQVLGACALGLTAVVFSVRLVRHRGWRGWYAVLWTALAGTLGLAGFMEYFVQRWSKKLVFGYSVMTAALAAVVVLVLVVRGLAVSAEKKEFAFRQQSR